MKNSKLALAISLALSINTAAVAHDNSNLTMEVIGTYETGIFDEGAAEIVAHDARNQRVFVINANDATVDVLDINDPANPSKMKQIDVSDYGKVANSVAVYKNLVAVAVEANDKQAPGKVVFFDTTNLSYINDVTVGALPDMVTFTPNGRYVLAANEGEPNDDYTVDPEGSVSIISLRYGPKHATVRTASFEKYNGMEEALREKGIRIFGPGATAAQDFEPEYITVSSNSRFAWVAMQEANALAVIDIKRAKVIKLLPLGTKDHSLPGNELDASNKDDGINITNWPVKGMYMPDSIASYKFKGRTYIVTANEGDSRDYDGYSEEERIKDLTLDPDAFPNAAELQASEALGRLKTTTANGDTDGDGDFDELYSYGARSFSIWSAYGKLIYDSGADFEKITAKLIPDDFNSTNDANDSFDNRSDDKGPEPEGITIGKIGKRTIAFIGLERVGGIMAYDITNPKKVEFLSYLNNRNFDADVLVEVEDEEVLDPNWQMAGDLGPEGLVFISAQKSPIKKPLLVVGNEVSGTTTIYQINVEKKHKKWKKNKSRDDD